MKKNVILKKKPKNILIISMRYHGDVLLTTPLIKTIKEAYPEANVDILIYTGTQLMLAGNPHLREIITTPPKPTFSEYFGVIKKIFRKYDLSIATQTGDRRILYAILASSNSIGLVPDRTQKGWWKRHLLTAWKEQHPLKPHTVLKFVQLAMLTGAKPKLDLVPPINPDFTPPSNFNINEPFVVIHCKPQWTYKEWPIENWGELSQYLHSLGFKIILSGGPGEEEANYVGQVYQLAPKGTINLTGKTSLSDLGHIISKAQLFVGPDTGVTHLAAATGVPVIALYGPTIPVEWSPWPINYHKEQSPFHATGSQVVNNVYLVQGESLHNCVPCHQVGCEGHKLSRSQCLDTLSTKKVINCIHTLLNI